MSAFICGSDHFKALAIFAVGNRHGSMRVNPQYIDGLKGLFGKTGKELASAYADVLYAENQRSVFHRYPDATEDNAPGPIDAPDHIRVTNTDLISPKYLALSPVAILKMCDCLEYQSCETEDYRRTPAFDLLDRIRGTAINALPGYDSAPWDYSVTTSKAA